MVQCQAEEEAAALAKKRAELEEEMARARCAAAGLPAILAFGEADRAKRNRAEKLAKGKIEDVASGSKGSGSKGHKEHTSGSSHKADPKVPLFASLCFLITLRCLHHIIFWLLRLPAHFMFVLVEL